MDIDKKPGGSWIQTFTGRRIDPLNPRAEDIDPRDIAHALAMQCRFTGHTRFHYSVAQHTVLMVRCLTRQWPHARPYAHAWDLINGVDAKLIVIARCIALHDAAEAYLADVARPVKRSEPMAGYRQIEQHLERVITMRFLLDWTPEIAERVKDLDGRMLIREARSLVAGDLNDWDLTKFGRPADVDIVPWSPADAEYALLNVFSRLGIA